ncbi:MAG: alkaline phosphatase family protein [Thermoplasmata archaeon]|nr:alkaline phosphatase family protein [Thermoplasmata archaeon]
MSASPGDRPRPHRLLIIGLDSAPPEYLFDRCLPVMPNVRRLVRDGVHAALRSTDPPITIPSWPVMFTGVDPGTLGFYGFRHRLDHSYTRNYGPSSTLLPVPSLWRLMSDRGRRVCVIGMPPGYPPPPVNGYAISDFLTPEGSHDITYPASLREEIEGKYGPYRFDVTFRAAEREQLYRDIVQMTQTRFAIAEDLYSREPWDVFAIHEIGTDRLHHAYTKYFDPKHQDFVPGNPFERVCEEYYRIVDQCIGRLLARIDDQTLVVIASDHGSMPMLGCFCINQWLAEKGYLSIQGSVPAGTPLEKAKVDWSKTTIWGAGGYYARLFFNVKGREPLGIVDATDVGALAARVKRDLGQLTWSDGSPMKTEVIDPHTIYRKVTGDPPDLMVYFDELRWRSAGSIGHPSLYLRENDTGPDDAVHGFDGVFVAYDPTVKDGRSLPTLQVLDVMPTLLSIIGEPIPLHVQGKVVAEARPGFSAPAGTPNGQS